MCITSRFIEKQISLHSVYWSVMKAVEDDVLPSKAIVRVNKKRCVLSLLVGFAHLVVNLSLVCSSWCRVSFCDGVGICFGVPPFLPSFLSALPRLGLGLPCSCVPRSSFSSFRAR